MARFSRRDLASLLAVAPLAAQNVPATNQPRPVSAPGSNTEALDQVKDASKKLQALHVPMDVEPAFTFKP